ncbi:hypothetical protein GCM10023078_45040 [Gibbsiella greigii]
MRQDYLARIAEREAKRGLVEEAEAFLHSVRARTEEKTERRRAQVEKLNRMLFGTRSKKLRQQVEQATVQRAE